MGDRGVGQRPNEYEQSCVLQFSVHFDDKKLFLYVSKLHDGAERTQFCGSNWAWKLEWRICCERDNCSWKVSLQPGKSVKLSYLQAGWRQAGSHFPWISGEQLGAQRQSPPSN